MYRVRRRGGRLFLGAVAFCIAAAGAFGAPRADDSDGAKTDRSQSAIAPNPPRFEMWAGAQAFGQAWSLYSGVTTAPFSSIRQDGMRLRMVGGYGAYGYFGRRAVGAGSTTVEFEGAAAFGDLLLGYQKQLGPVTVKAFAGLAAAEHQLTPDDPETAIRGSGVGGKVAIETWWSLSERTWTSLDVSWASLHDSYATRARLGWRLLPALSAGLETGAAGNEECDIARVGGFLRVEWATGELSASGGVSSDQLLEGLEVQGLAKSSVPFATLSWLTRF